MENHQSTSDTYRLMLLFLCVSTLFVGAIYITACQKSDIPGIAESFNSPQVIETYPRDGAEEIPANTIIMAIFNTAMDTSTINEATFIVLDDTATVSGSFIYSDNSTTFTPAKKLKSNALITATISPEVTDVNGNAINQNYEWSFTVTDIDESERDPTPPKIIATTPSHRSTDIPITADVRASFSKAMNPSTINASTFFLTSDGATVSGRISYDDSTAVFTPTNTLDRETTYRATVTTGVQDFSDNNLENDYEWQFTTVPEEDNTPPMVISTDPKDDEDDVSVNTRIKVTFNEPINPVTVNEQTFLVHLHRWGRYFQVSGSVKYSNKTATFKPDKKLKEDTDYVGTITGDIADTAGNTMAETYRWRFETDDD